MLNDTDDNLFDFTRTKNPTPNLNLRYNREKRLENAPEVVQKMYSEEYLKSKGIFQSLVATKGLRFIFVVIIMSIFIVGVISFLPQNTLVIENTKIELKCTKSQEAIFAQLECNVYKDSETKTDPTIIIVAFTAMDKEGTVIDTKKIESIFNNDKLIISTSFKFFNIHTIQADILFGNRIKRLTQTI